MLTIGRNQDFQILTTLLENPQAGANFVYSMRSQYRELVIGVKFKLATSIAVANRLIQLNLVTAGPTNWLAAFPTAHTAANQQDYYWYRNFTVDPTAAATTYNICHLPPDWWILPSGSLSSVIGNIDVDDQISAVSVTVMRQISGEL